MNVIFDVQRSGPRLTIAAAGGIDMPLPFSRELGPTIVEYDNLSFHRSGPKTDPTAFFPKLSQQGFSRIDGSGKAQTQRTQLLRVVVASPLKKRTGGHAHGAETVQDRLVEAGLAGDLW